MATDPLIERLDAIHDRMGEVRRAVNAERKVRESEDDSLRELFDGRTRNFRLAIIAMVIAIFMGIAGFVYVNAETSHRCDQIEKVVDADTQILNTLDRPGAPPEAHDFVVQADKILAQARQC